MTNESMFTFKTMHRWMVWLPCLGSRKHFLPMLTRGVSQICLVSVKSDPLIGVGQSVGIGILQVFLKSRLKYLILTKDPHRACRHMGRIGLKKKKYGN